jgi:predicted ABC-type transport system involved in lysophospholipase L1 biosynthesis ATPase subunit
VAIARALAGTPEVLLADEPTANLDTAVGTQILEPVRDLARKEGQGALDRHPRSKVRRWRTAWSAFGTDSSRHEPRAGAKG